MHTDVPGRYEVSGVSVPSGAVVDGPGLVDLIAATHATPDGVLWFERLPDDAEEVHR